MKVLISGGNGFIARNLFEQLGNKYSIIAPNKKELNFLDTSKVFNYIRKNKFDVIIHSATYDAASPFSTKNPINVLENNLKMFFNIIRGKEYFGKLIYFGSGAEFNRKKWVPKMKESYFDNSLPEEQYGFSKYIMTKYTLLSENIYNLRLFGVFGKYDDWRYRFIPNICCHAVLNKPIMINQNRLFDYLYINDLVKIVEWFINNKPDKKIYNVCTGKSYDLRTFAEITIEISGKKLDIIIKKPGLGKEYSGDNSLLLKELKNFKFTSVRESIKDLYTWFEINKHIINEEELYL